MEPSQIGLTVPTQANSAAVKGHDGNHLLDVALNNVVNIYRRLEERADCVVSASFIRNPTVRS
jgi:hypothetical protein